MQPTRRTLLKALAATTALATRRLPAAPAFPPQDQIDNDPLRPRFHLMPRRGWMNDPCAPVFFKGTYHLFFQYNPGASVWGDMHWAHAASPDMIHWQPRPIALAPSPGGPDSFGVWTGSMVLNGGTPTILYTATEFSPREAATMKDATPHPIRESQCLATPTNSSLDTWIKLPTPVLAAPPPGMEVTGFRDPVPFRLNDTWYMLLASGELGKGGDVLLYQSPDLRHWTYKHIFAQGKPTGVKTPDTVDSGEMWECPDFFPLGPSSDQRYVLIHSTGTPSGRATLWQSGLLDPTTMRWTPEHEGILNHGPYYAPKTQLDAAGNRILWGWIPETRPEAEYSQAGWAGCMSLPRILTLEAGEVRFHPAPQTASLRASSAADPNAPQTEIFLTLERSSSNPSQALRTDRLQVDLKEADLTTLTWSGKPVPLNQPLPGKLTIRAWIDHSVLEVFVGDRLVLTERVYGKTPAILTLPANYRASSLRTHTLKSI